MPLRLIKHVGYRVKKPSDVEGILATAKASAENGSSEFRLGVEAVIKVIGKGFFPQDNIKSFSVWSLEDIESILNTAISMAMLAAKHLKMPLSEEYVNGVVAAFVSISRGFGFEYIPD